MEEHSVIVVFTVQTKNVRTANTGMTVLLNESEPNKWKQDIDFFYSDPLPTNFLYQ